LLNRLSQALLQLVDAARHRARLRTWESRRAVGRRGEDLAHRYLRRHGYIIVARNYRTRSLTGEVDVVAWDGETLVFVEVKTRSSADFGAPDRNIGREKEIHLRRAARDYATRAEVPWELVRFDSVSIVLSTPPAIELARDVFNPRGRVS
jgi:putative endonuclease